MKISFINAPVGTIEASQESVIYHMANYLSKNHKVTVITGKSRKKPLLDKITNASFKVITVPFWPRNSPLNNFLHGIYKRLHPWKIESLSMYLGVKLRSSVKDVIKNSDVIITYYRTDIIKYSNLAYKFKVPCVASFQFSGFDERFFNKDRSIMYLANSEYTKESMEKKHNIKFEGIITPGLSEEFFNETSTISEMTAQKSLLFVGRIIITKGVVELIDIFQRVSEKCQDCRLFIIGSGIMEDKLVEKTKKLGIEDRVKFLGEISYKDMPKYYNSATLLIHPSYEETFGMVVLEAMAAGTPVVAANLPALREISGDVAQLLPLSDQDKWVEKIGFLLENENIRNQLAQKGKEKAREHLWENKVKQLEKYLIKAAGYKGKL